MQATEGVGFTTRRERVAAVTDRVQRAIMSPKYRALMVRPDGSRRGFLPADTVLGEPLALTARDTLVCTGAGWTHNDIEAITAGKPQLRFRFVLFCHDIIPLMFSPFYQG